jgi:hypothetical protein
MSEKPSYLGLLNAIAVAETEAEKYLDCWAATTTHAGVRQVISTVALREGEHGKAFAKRICELGYGVMWKERPDGDSRLATAADCNLTDLQKFERFGLGREEREDDIFSSMFKDKNIDIQTGQLLGRYIAEERDSGRMLRACYEQLQCEAGSPPAGAPNGVDERLARIEAILGQVCEKLSASA